MHSRDMEDVGIESAGRQRRFLDLLQRHVHAGDNLVRLKKTLTRQG